MSTDHKGNPLEDPFAGIEITAELVVLAVPGRGFEASLYLPANAAGNRPRHEYKEKGEQLPAEESFTLFWSWLTAKAEELELIGGKLAGVKCTVRSPRGDFGPYTLKTLMASMKYGLRAAPQIRI